MKHIPLISICIPTNGVVEWVFPTLDSIYKQGIDNELFEVVITDNGENQRFKELIKKYLDIYNNIVYTETNVLPFINEIESYKRANGELIKFLNHRALLADNSLLYLIGYVKDNLREKPVTYFSNGVLSISRAVHEYDTFDNFVKALSYWSSWSSGMAIWKSDFKKLAMDTSKFNKLFPHTNILFNERNRQKYIVDNTVIFSETPQGNRPKGNYDLYGAFGIEYPDIIKQLEKDHSITAETFRFVANKNLEFIASLYWDYNIRKKYCSYELGGLVNMYGKYYTKRQFMLKVIRHGCIGCIKKILKMIGVSQ